MAQTIKIGIDLELELQKYKSQIQTMQQLLDKVKPNTKAYDTISRVVDKLNEKLTGMYHTAEQGFSSTGQIDKYQEFARKFTIEMQNAFSLFNKLEGKDLVVAVEDENLIEINRLIKEINVAKKQLSQPGGSKFFDNFISNDAKKNILSLKENFKFDTGSIQEASNIINREIEKIDSEIKTLFQDIDALDNEINNSFGETFPVINNNKSKIEDSKQTLKRQLKQIDKWEQEGRLDRALSAEGDKRTAYHVDENTRNSVLGKGLEGLDESERTERITAFYEELRANARKQAEETIKELEEINAQLEARWEELYNPATGSKEKERSDKLWEIDRLYDKSYDLEDTRNELSQGSTAYETQLRKEIEELRVQVLALNTALRDKLGITEQTKNGSKAAADVNREVAESLDQEKQSALQAAAANEKLSNIQSAIKQWFGFNEVINLTKRAISGAISHIRELDAVMTEIAVVTDMTQAELWDQIGTYSAMAQQYGVATKGVYEVSQLYYQQGDDKDFSRIKSKKICIALNIL